MTYLLDTDHFSSLQRLNGPEWANLSKRMAVHSAGDCVISIITFHEQVIGAHARIQSAKNATVLLEGYDFLQRAFIGYGRFDVVGFDQAAQNQLATFGGDLRVNKRDLRIAAITLANDLILLTRNRSDFGRVPNLKFEDWLGD